MRLNDYIAETGTKLTHLAKEIGCEASTLHDIKTGRRSPSLTLAVAIERATGGQVTCAEMATPTTTEAA